MLVMCMRGHCFSLERVYIDEVSFCNAIQMCIGGSVGLPFFL